jgi:2-polyprenyl-3-methyl-5-hydroxy-6-metoxy-1,4-benzoquinol methylase
MFSSMFDSDVEITTKTYEFPTTNNNNNNKITTTKPLYTIHIQCVTADNQHIERWVPHVVWSAAIELCNELAQDHTNNNIQTTSTTNNYNNNPTNNSLTSFFLHKRILEVGSGTGLCGLLCSMISQTGLCVLTDGNEEAVAELEKSIQLNTLCVGRTFAHVLPWGSPKHIQELLVKYDGQPFDVIVGTDVIYEEETIEPLLRTAHGCVNPNHGIIILANHKYRFRAFESTVTTIAKKIGGLTLMDKKQLANTVDVLIFIRNDDI